MTAPDRLLLWLAIGLVTIASGCSGRGVTREEAIADALDAMRAAARQHIADMQRQPVVLKAIDGLQAELASFDDALRLGMEQVRALNANPDTSRADLEVALKSLDAGRKQARQRILQRHFEIIDMTSADEWSTLAPHEKRALLAAVK
ncbi:MAG TPA: hypothetical protein VHB46_02040 [Burkholderiales bacterium]|nr:hypothetical protein [Burkholderiales bacterium]